MLRVLIHFTHLPEPAVLSHGGFKLLGRAALSDHPPRWISPYQPSPASQLQSRARRLRSSIELLHMLSNHITSFEREDLRKAASTVLCLRAEDRRCGKEGVMRCDSGVWTV